MALRGSLELRKGSRKSTNMVLIASIEKRGRQVLYVSKQCAKEQTEANDGYTEHRDLGGQPALRRSCRTDQTGFGMQMD